MSQRFCTGTNGTRKHQRNPTAQKQQSSGSSVARRDTRLSTLNARGTTSIRKCILMKAAFLTKWLCASSIGSDLAVYEPLIGPDADASHFQS